MSKFYIINLKCRYSLCPIILVKNLSKPSIFKHVPFTLLYFLTFSFVFFSFFFKWDGPQICSLNSSNNYCNRILPLWLCNINPTLQLYHSLLREKKPTVKSKYHASFAINYIPSKCFIGWFKYQTSRSNTSFGFIGVE